ncbi:hypothetical protein EDI_235190 [Entamoeba dispar SAW760]|uniref:protein disulfide-isomerase n=1 Tax=Entamoeba dispar (strain ATCC PRA-260 / SAW760) TaxID=370354 RepID=B0ELA3_ENTDS|nr:uncharacterized protein EDI_235190 [Entamoeba dispar SAW760]EDR24717.1 hypothetical protein EDI_235190 [Entamoeba dispar SAW760]|eukprot:EDR24717.1 hypothetical protein EDI_235190 [Entamoeba dispar SAW760]
MLLFYIFFIFFSFIVEATKENGASKGLKEMSLKKFKFVSLVNGTEFRQLFNDDNQYVVALFCHLTIQECIPIIKTLNKVGEKYRQIKFVVVDRDSIYDLVFDYSIEEFPTILFHRAHLRDRTFDEDEFDSLEEFIQRGIQPVVYVINEEDLSLLERQKKITYIVLFTSESTPQHLINEYNDIADVFQQYSELGFFLVDKTRSSLLKNKTEQLIYYNNKAYDNISEIIEYPYLDSNKTKVINNEFGLIEWVSAMGIPLFYDGSKQLIELLFVIPKKYPIVWYFDINITEQIKSYYVSLSRAYRGELVFIYTDDKETMEFYHQNHTKTITILHKNGRTSYPLNQTQFDVLELTLQRFLANELQPDIKSSNHSKQGDIPFLTGEEWNKGLDPTKDYFIILIDNSILSKNFVNREFSVVYKRIAPILEKNTLEMYLFNIETDDAPVDILIDDIPTYLFYKMNDNTQQNPTEQEFKQFPDQDSLIKYIQYHSSIAFQPLPPIDKSKWPQYIEDDEEEQVRRLKAEELKNQRLDNIKEAKDFQLKELKENPFKNEEFVIALNQLRKYTEDPEIAKFFQTTDWNTLFGIDIDSLEGLVSLTKNEDALRLLFSKEKKIKSKTHKKDQIKKEL